MTIYGYVRVSSREQNKERQIKAITDYVKDGEIANIYIDKQSGKDFERSKYLELRNKVRNGDVIVIKEMDRLGRNKQMIKEELEYYKDRDVKIVILNIPTTTMDLSQFGEEMAKSMMEMINNILIEVLSTIAEEERKKIKQRQPEGIAIAKANGVYKGRKVVTKDELPKEFGKLYKQWKLGYINATQFSKLLGVKSRTTLYKYIKLFKEEDTKISLKINV